MSQGGIHDFGPAPKYVQDATIETSTTFNTVLTKLLVPIGHHIGYPDRCRVSPVGKERDEGMLLQIKQSSRIENPREYPARAVEDLRGILAVGTEAQSDPQRENFYELENNNNTYYIHVSPITGNVILLAKWSGQQRPCYAAAGSLVA
jgi:hypothetical protein